MKKAMQRDGHGSRQHGLFCIGGVERSIWSPGSAGDSALRGLGNEKKGLREVFSSSGRGLGAQRPRMEKTVMGMENREFAYAPSFE